MGFADKIRISSFRKIGATSNYPHLLAIFFCFSKTYYLIVLTGRYFPLPQDFSGINNSASPYTSKYLPGEQANVW